MSIESGPRFSEERNQDMAELAKKQKIDCAFVYIGYYSFQAVENPHIKSNNCCKCASWG